MKDIIRRFKRALAAFLRDELLEYIGYNQPDSFGSLGDRFVVNHVEFETMVMEQVIKLPQYPTREYEDSPFFLEDQIQECKKVFAHKLLDHIHIDTAKLIHDDFIMDRRIKLVLRVQKKQH